MYLLRSATISTKLQEQINLWNEHPNGHHVDAR